MANIRNAHVTFNPSSEKKERTPFHEIDQNIQNNEKLDETDSILHPSDFYKQSPELVPK